MTAPTPRLPGTRQDSRTKRRYLAMLRAAQKRYDAIMARPRRRRDAARATAVQRIRAGDAAGAEAGLKVAFDRFRRARLRAERAKSRLRARAVCWLRRRGASGAFRPEGRRSQELVVA